MGYFVCQLCSAKVKFSVDDKDSLRQHIHMQHEMFLKEFDELWKMNKKDAFNEGSLNININVNSSGVVHLTSSKERNLGFNFHAILEETLHTDVTFHLCDGKLALHRLVLEAASPYLKHMFKSETSHWEQDIHVSLPDFYISDMQPILPFLYGLHKTLQKL